MFQPQKTPCCTRCRRYNKLIQSHADWLYCGVYADEGISGTKNDRAEYQRMLTDCREGKLDLLLTKSISRFARNTVTLLETVRELKALHVDLPRRKSIRRLLSGEICL